MSGLDLPRVDQFPKIIPSLLGDDGSHVDARVLLKELEKDVETGRFGDVARERFRKRIPKKWKHNNNCLNFACARA